MALSEVWCPELDCKNNLKGNCMANEVNLKAKNGLLVCESKEG